MSDLHRDRVFWVTGAASGIGQATAEELVAVGGRVIASDLPDADFSWATDSPSIVIASCDVRNESDNEDAVATAIEHFGRLDGAVLNAGFAPPTALMESSLDTYNQVMEINVIGVLQGIRAAAPRMEPGSAMTVTASISGLRADPGLLAYNASKAAALNLVRSASMELAVRGIRINTVCPGPIETAMTSHIPGEVKEAVRQNIPLKRWGSAREVAEVHSWLLSEKASFVTGAHLPVDGGVSANNGQFQPPGD
ncbi:MAG: SDR family oxidoreductase [Pseudomonadota bacterium]